MWIHTMEIILVLTSCLIHSPTDCYDWHTVAENMQVTLDNRISLYPSTGCKYELKFCWGVLLFGNPRVKIMLLLSVGCCANLQWLNTHS
ncbi:hypothetical protein DFH05DRAFT_1514813 [Lentinula detonsa]|uniref:Secreted protein n=1 Tax=Lentinula detonsa TaxID=2804962 RepID=A0A9W8TSX1_9AGAR|nr:hypothetical protein DFH05DRAFT_1514813 [Lentinula detonsa]